MPHNGKILVIGKQRPSLDSELVANIVLALGKQLWEERHTARRPKRRRRVDPQATEREGRP